MLYPPPTPLPTIRKVIDLRPASRVDLPPPTPPAYVRLLIVLDLGEQGRAVLTDLYRQQGSEHWRPLAHWRGDGLDPSADCTQLELNEQVVAIQSPEGQELYAEAEHQMLALTVAHQFLLEPYANMPASIRKARRMAFITAALALLQLAVLIVTIVRLP